MEQGGIIAGIEGVVIGIPIGELPLTKQDDIHQLKPFTLIVIKGELYEVDPIGDVHRKVK